MDITVLVMTTVVVCLILWRISYGMKNGLFAEAAGLIAVMAAFVCVHYFINIVKNVIDINLGSIASKIGYLLVAFLVYRIMTSVAEAFRKIKDIPIVGAADRVLGGVLGAVEAVMIILLIEYITDIDIIKTVLTACYEIVIHIQKSFINNLKK